MPAETFLSDLKNIIAEKKETDYDDVILKKASYPYLYHLSALRANILDWISIGSGEHVLELNAGCGALTGVLLKRAGRVTAVTETSEEAQMIRERCAGSGERLSVYTRERFLTEQQMGGGGERTLHSDTTGGSAVQREKQEYHKIFLIGQASRFYGTMKAACQYLEENGKCYLADANRLGLRYFAGCQDEYRQGYFAGIEGYGEEAAERCYTRKEYEAMLQEAGFTEWSCYYPYPDHKFPASIYSDAWLPKTGELNDNQRNYDKDRYQLFDERRAFDTIIKEGLFSEFANSFLFEAGAGTKEARARVVYSRHANERAARYQVRTDIVELPGRSRRVIKYAFKKEGEAHIAHMAYAYEKLCACYDDENIAFCGCCREEEGVSFPFVPGISLQELLEQALRGQRDAWIEKILSDYCQRIRSLGGSRTYAPTTEFYEIFGSDPNVEAVLDGLECPLYCDVDLIFSNILVEMDCEKLLSPQRMRWQVIDYEWSFGFPLPKAFVLYRAMYYAYYQIFCGSDWTLPRLFSLAGVTEEQQALFLKMEEHFQRHIAGGGFPVRTMQRIMGTKIVRLQETQFLAPREFGRAKSISFHIDREEYQDGCVVCSGWALAEDWRHHGAPVELTVEDETGAGLMPEITRSERADVAAVRKLQGEDAPFYGFDCIFPAKREGRWQITFIKGHLKKRYRSKNF